MLNIKRRWSTLCTRTAYGLDFCLQNMIRSTMFFCLFFYGEKWEETWLYYYYFWEHVHSFQNVPLELSTMLPRYTRGDSCGLEQSASSRVEEQTLGVYLVLTLWFWTESKRNTLLFSFKRRRWRTTAVIAVTVILIPASYDVGTPRPPPSPNLPITSFHPCLILSIHWVGTCMCAWLKLNSPI